MVVLPPAPFLPPHLPCLNHFLWWGGGWQDFAPSQLLQADCALAEVLPRTPPPRLTVLCRIRAHSERRTKVAVRAHPAKVAPAAARWFLPRALRLLVVSCL